MTRTAMIVGGTGQIGLATAAAMTAEGWRVLCARRTASDPTPPPTKSVTLDREEPGALARAVGTGVDALIDTVAYDSRHAEQLLAIAAACRSAEAMIGAGLALPPYMRRMFDYAAEDAWLEAHA